MKGSQEWLRAFSCVCYRASMLPMLLALAMPQTSPLDAVSKGSVLYHHCQAALRMVNSDQGVSDEELASVRLCTSYLDGIADGLSITRKACTGNASREAILRVYIAFMDRNPPYFDMHKAEGAYVAMMASYACPAPKK